MIRIIGGLYRGKKLPVPDIKGLRPTPDRVRETVFNWLMHRVKKSRCLDAFAGTGALGFEAFSRGASEIIFVELEPKASANLEKTIKEFKSSGLSLIKMNAQNYLKQNVKPFDIIFLDPPFADNYIPECLDLIIKHQLLAGDGYVYIESPAPIPVNLDEWQYVKLKKAGNVVYGLLELLM